ncbi:MAG TPA: glyoxalase/bleomycin resistance/extradiol dioxygenase family protein [Anaerolineaceae bacterium]|nr:glyoxalase/bleomycin resistance/extradiol dioxygenase family protein [Anaerolineaceae bacterium]
MINNIFVNFHVKDLEKAKEFFTQLGFKINPQFTNEEAACVILGPNMYAMLLIEKLFIDFTKRPVSEAPKIAEVITSLFLENRADVDVLADKALRAGALNYTDPLDLGYMYSRSFQDLDGHLWEVGWMDPNHVEPF